MRRLALIILLALAAPFTAGARTFSEGHDYVLVTPAQATTVPAGKVEVLEVFSYGCPACNAFQPTMERLKKSLPANAQLAYLPAAFNTAEDWPMFQRAYLTAQFLGVADKAHQAMFDAVWKTHELSVADPDTHRLKDPLPSIEDAARFYARVTGVKPQEFLATARSFTIDMKMKAADAQMLAMQVPSTPCLVVNGKYRIIHESVPTPEEIIDLVKFLVAKETPAR